MPRTSTSTKAAKEAASKYPPFDMDAVAPQHRDQVAGMIPPKRIEENYLHRNIAGVYDFDVFEIARRTRHNVLMPGPTGAGKTTAARAYAAARGCPFVAVEMQGGFDFASVVGSTRADAETGLPQFKKGELTLAVEYPSVILLDEVNFAPPRFTAAFHGTLDARQSLYVHEIGERIAKHPDTVIFSAYNSGYTGTVRLNEAFENRFAFVIPWGYSDEVEDALIGAYSPRLLKMVRGIRGEKGVRTDIGTNVMEEFLTITAEGGITLASFLFINRFPETERLIIGRVVEANLAAIEEELEASLNGEGLAEAELVTS